MGDGGLGGAPAWRGPGYLRPIHVARGGRKRRVGTDLGALAAGIVARCESVACGLVPFAGHRLFPESPARPLGSVSDASRAMGVAPPGPQDMELFRNVCRTRRSLAAAGQFSGGPQERN